MTEDTKERTLGLSPAQVAGSALAAVTAAVLASFAGAAGTIIGAAFGSIVATVGAAAYTWWLRRTSEAVRRTAIQVRATRGRTGALPRRVSDGPLRPGRRSRRSEDVVADPEDGTGSADAITGPRNLSWRKMALATLTVLVTTLGGITAVEAITGRPLSALLGNNDSSGTTLGHVSGGDDDKQVPTEDESTPVPSPTPSPTTSIPVPVPTPVPGDGATPTPDADPAAPGTTPADPTPTPTPTTDPGVQPPDGVTGN